MRVSRVSPPPLPLYFFSTVYAKGNYGAEKGIPRGQSLRYSKLAKGLYLNRALARVTSIPIIYLAPLLSESRRHTMGMTLHSPVLGATPTRDQ